MGGGGIDGVEWVSPSKRTLVLVGRTGNGKSATGNSILGKTAFRSARQLSGVTETCELQEATMKDGRVVNVIDTPALLDSAAKSDLTTSKEVVKCLELAKNGIHAVLVVLSARSRFSDEDGATIRNFHSLLGNKIFHYMIAVFTGGDEIPSLSHYLEGGCPETVKGFISLCGDRLVLFDNKTMDESKKDEQVQKLLSLVDDVISQNGGLPYTSDRFLKLKEKASVSCDTNGILKSMVVPYRSNILKAQEVRMEKMTQMEFHSKMVGGGMDSVEWVSPSKRTLVLVGRTGNGKSATGNTILGKIAFKSARQLSGVTETCELQEAMMKDGRVVDVIDTPALLDSAARSDPTISKEVVKCLELAKDGIHAVLVVLSARSRFSDEDGKIIRNLQSLFGSKISDYMIAVFTGGDEIPSLPHYLEGGFPETLKGFISLCGGRLVLFDNKTMDESKKDEQVQKLLSLVDDVLSQNGGQPYTRDRFLKLKEKASVSCDTNGNLKSMVVPYRSNILKAQEVRMEKMTEMIELKMEEETGELKMQLAEEQAARLRAEQVSQEAQLKLIEINELREQLEMERVRRRQCPFL